MVWLTALNGVVSAQAPGQGDGGENGIYLTHEDFNRDVLSYPSSQVGDVLKEMWGGSIRLTRNGRELTFRFGEFYGYKARGYKFSSFGKKSAVTSYGYYQHLDQSGLFVYVQRIPHAKFIYVDEPYFSLQDESVKYPLKVRNLRRQLHLDPATLRDVKKIRRQFPSLATVVDHRCVINGLLFSR